MNRPTDQCPKCSTPAWTKRRIEFAQSRLTRLVYVCKECGHIWNRWSQKHTGDTPRVIVGMEK